MPLADARERARDNNKSIAGAAVKVAIVGGTGAMGRGFALRWSPRHEVIIGSRDAGRAQEAASGYAEAARAALGEGAASNISGASNADAAASADALVLSIPYENIGTVCPGVLPRTRESCIVISPIVPMERTEAGFEFVPFRDGKKSAHESVAAHMRDPSRLVSAFHVISEKKLADPARALDYDIFVCGDSAECVDAVCGLVSDIAGLRALRLGGGSLAYMAEVATPLLLNAMIRNKLKSPGIKLV